MGHTISLGFDNRQRTIME